MPVRIKSWKRDATPGWVKDFWRNNPERSRDMSFRRNYGISEFEWDEKFKAQGRKCANSGCQADKPGNKKGWHTDHCHKTGKLRGILCSGCNVALGQVNDSYSKLIGLIYYLKTHNA